MKRLTSLTAKSHLGSRFLTMQPNGVGLYPIRKSTVLSGKSNMQKSQPVLVFIFALSLFTFDAAAQKTGKVPVIIIPGVTGSQLINPKTGKTVWFSVRRDKDDDIRLPIASPILERNRDGLKPTDIIRKVVLPVLPDVEVYQSLIDALIAHGYSEGDWNKPKGSDVFYVFPYDWRRDNVESAHYLTQKIAAIKRSLRRPDLKIDIIAHSMGGLIARYAAMYGMADLPPDGKAPTPNWSGAASINRLMMFGTPNEGSYKAFAGLLNGYPMVASRNLPLIDDFRAEDVMTSPSAFQLLPHQSYVRFLDENLRPLPIDIYDPETWYKYGWGALSDPKFLGKLRDAARLAITNKDIKPTPLKKNASMDDRLTAQTTYPQARAYFAAALNRAKRFQAALDVAVEKVPIQLYAYGGNCKETPDGVLLLRDVKKDKWLTILDARDIKTVDGKEIKKDDVKAAIFGLGDGTVTQRSLLMGSKLPKNGAPEPVKTNFPLTSTFFSCGLHTQLFLEKPIQDSFLSALAVEQQKQP